MIPTAGRPHAAWGLVCAVGAYGLWGLIPLYFRAVAAVAPLELLAYRAAWSFGVLAVIVGLTGQWRPLVRALTQRRTVLLLALSTLLIAANWLMFIYAVVSRQLLQSSLGYFINPLMNVLMGVVLLREPLRPRQRWSIMLAGVGVAAQALLVGAVPWLALALASTFALYGLLKKTMPLGGLVGLTVETGLLTPMAAVYLAWLHGSDEATRAGLALHGLLAASGVVTTVPLLLFIAAAQRLRLSTLGFVQYLAPSLQFALAVFAFGEPFSTTQLVSFGCIWTAVAFYTVDSVHASRQRHLEVVEPD